MAGLDDDVPPVGEYLEDIRPEIKPISVENGDFLCNPEGSGSSPETETAPLKEEDELNEDDDGVQSSSSVIALFFVSICVIMFIFGDRILIRILTVVQYESVGAVSDADESITQTSPSGSSVRMEDDGTFYHVS